MVIADYDPRSITFKVEFTSPLSVSTGDKPDKLQIKFVEPDLFVSAETGDAIDMGDERVEENIPRQFPDEDLFENLGSTAAAVQVAS